MAQIIPFSGWTKLPIPVETVLDAAKNCAAVLVLGWDEAGEFYAAASMAERGELLWLVELFKHKLLAGDYDCG